MTKKQLTEQELGGGVNTQNKHATQSEDTGSCVISDLQELNSQKLKQKENDNE